MKRTEREKIDWEAIKAAVIGGEPFRSVAARYQLKVSRISMRASREGWRVRKLRTEVNEAALAVAEAPEEWRREAALIEARAEVAEHRARQFNASLAVKGSSARVLKRMLQYVETLSAEEILQEYRAVTALIKAAGGLFRWQAEDPPTTDGRLISPAINVALIRTTPEQLREIKKARDELLRKQERKVEAQARVLQEAPAARREDGKPKASPPAAEPMSVGPPAPDDNADPDDAARREQRPWWDKARVQKLLCESLDSKEGPVTASISDRTAVQDMGELEARRAQQRKESRENFGHCGR